MPRAVNGTVRKNRVKRVLKRAKGFYGRRSKVFSIANQAVKKALANQYIGRKLRKREFRRLWNIRISAGAKSLGTSYSKLIFALKKSSITLNRKMLAHLAVNQFEDFKKVVDTCKKHLK